MKPDVKLVGNKEIADILHVNQTTVYGWYTRQKTTNYPDPVNTRVQQFGTLPVEGPVWNLDEVLDWWINWTPRRGRPKLGYLTDERHNNNGKQA